MASDKVICEVLISCAWVIGNSLSELTYQIVITGKWGWVLEGYAPKIVDLNYNMSRVYYSTMLIIKASNAMKPMTLGESSHRRKVGLRPELQ